MFQRLIVDKMNELTIREWFSQFGPLNQVIIDPAWGKAILVYADYDSAAKAWNDPRPVFSNRFVKIWWKKTENSASEPPSEKLSGAIVDQVELEIAREAAAKAQKEHEEKQRRKEELEKKREELERQRLELVEKQRVERERLLEKIKRAEEKAKEKARGVVNSAAVSTTKEDVEKKNVKEASTEEVQANGHDDRKAHLQKMLSDLQNQVRLKFKRFN
jgi:RNA-binding protein 26